MKKELTIREKNLIYFALVEKCNRLYDRINIHKTKMQEYAQYAQDVNDLEELKELFSYKNNIVVEV